MKLKFVNKILAFGIFILNTFYLWVSFQILVDWNSKNGISKDFLKFILPINLLIITAVLVFLENLKTVKFS